MPRRHRSARDRPGPPPPAPSSTLAHPGWAQVPGYDVRAVLGDKAYRCPGCDHEIRRGLPHLVVVPEDAPDQRRHWHERCWRQELRRARPR